MIEHNHVVASLMLYRMGKYDEALRILESHGGVFAARDVLAELIKSLCYIAKDQLSEATSFAMTAELHLKELGLSDKVSRPQLETSYYTSVIWREPLVLLREVKKKLAERAVEIAVD